MSAVILEFYLKPQRTVFPVQCGLPMAHIVGIDCFGQQAAAVIILFDDTVRNLTFAFYDIIVCIDNRTGHLVFIAVKYQCDCAVIVVNFFPDYFRTVHEYFPLCLVYTVPEPAGRHITSFRAVVRT